MYEIVMLFSHIGGSKPPALRNICRRPLLTCQNPLTIPPKSFIMKTIIIKKGNHPNETFPQLYFREYRDV